MKHKILAIALVSALPLVAQAQTSVTMYGMVDASIGVENNDAPGESSRTVVSSGTQSASRIGFRGTEDLGNGLKALFNIEAAVAVDTGATDSNMFQRRAVVGLQGAFGTVTVGREYGPIAAVAAASDTLGQGFYGSNLAAFGANRLTRRLSNSVNYQSNALSGFTVRAAYGAGERSIDPSGDVTGVSLEYANAGLYVGAGYQNVERLATGDDKEYNAGIGYKFGDFEVRAGYMAADPETGILRSAKYEQKNAGVSYGFGANRVFLNYQQQELATGAEGKAVTVAYSYTLSKRTNVYASYAKLRNNNNGVFSLTSPSGTIALPATAFGSDPQVYNVGVRHSF
ncbi:putative porin [Massilia sp. MP_M2]|uniref:porin n=1 Tax=Massilia sp. MP_M2 TaxID=3071713 RepID=UPI00319DCD99